MPETCCGGSVETALEQDVAATGNGQRDHSICFVAQYALGAMSGGRAGFVGGIEWQQSLMGRWFADRGYRVSMLTWDEGQPDGIEIDGVRVLKICRADEGIRGVRFLHPRWTGLVRAMKRADADLYYQNCGEYVTGQVAAWCRRHGRRFVYSVASDPDCDPKLPTMKTVRERVLYRYGLKRADRVIAQTLRQQHMLRDGFDVDSVVIPMPCPGPVDTDYHAPDPPKPESVHIVWVGRVAEVKRPELLVDLAQAMPEVTFDLIGPDSAGDFSRRVMQRAAEQPNIVVRGRVAREDMPDCYRQASLLCCTSAYEGLPNTFLEAWSHGVPAVSTFDPGDLIQTHNLGAIAADVPGLVASIRSLVDSPDRWRTASENARRYYVQNHTVESVMPRFELVFTEALGSQATADPNARR